MVRTPCFDLDLNGACDGHPKAEIVNHPLSPCLAAPPPTINETGGGEEGKVKMIVGLLKKFMGVKVTLKSAS